MGESEIFANYTSDFDSVWKDAAHIQNDLLLICLFISCFLEILLARRLIRSYLIQLILSCYKLLLSY